MSSLDKFSLTDRQRRKKRRVVQTRRKVSLFEDFRGQTLSDDTVESGIFRDLTFCALPARPGAHTSHSEGCSWPYQEGARSACPQARWRVHAGPAS